MILITMLRSYTAVGAGYGQCNLSSLIYEIPHSPAVGSFIYVIVKACIYKKFNYKSFN